MPFTMALVQCNPMVGDVAGNRDMIISHARKAQEQGADLVVFPEMVLSGYPLQDLANDHDLVAQCALALQEINAHKFDAALVIGMPMPASLSDGQYAPDAIMNGLAICQSGEIIARRFKHDLPNSEVYDELRNFVSGPLMGPVSINDMRIGFLICEDCWHEQVAECLVETGAEILVAINGSVYDNLRADERLQTSSARVATTDLPLVYLNLVGGQDEVVFDGGSFVLNADCTLGCRMGDFTEEMALVHWKETDVGGWQVSSAPIIEPLQGFASTYRAMMTGLKDYVHKNGFRDVVLGLSGGLDSALSACVCVDALGAGHVRALIMPSVNNPQSSLDDALNLAQNLGIATDIVAIEDLRQQFGSALAPLIGDKMGGLTKENLQPRIRATLLMALANQTGAMLVTTGNKSEVAVGYCTLYGDMAGGYSILKDIYKTDVFALARWRNQADEAFLANSGAIIPDIIITKPPSAELRPDQRDDDNLPPYEVLDAILYGLIEQGSSAQHLVDQGMDHDTVLRVCHLLQSSEHKRFQSAPGVKLTRRAFGRDWRFPLTNRRKMGIEQSR